MSVSDRAMFAKLTIRQWRAVATDQEISDQVEDELEAASGTISTIKRLTPKEYTAPIRNLAALGRSEHKRITVPGMYKGQDILSSHLGETYMMIQGQIKEKFMASVAALVDYYPTILNEAPERLGKGYRESDFPTVEQLQGLFEYKVSFTPIPDLGKDWRLEGLSSQTSEQIADELKAEITNMYADGTKVLFSRAKEALENIAKQAEEYKEGDRGRLKKQTLRNIREFAYLLPAMNVTGDPLLDQVAREMIEHFSSLEAKEMRELPETRAAAATKARELLGRMASV